MTTRTTDTAYTSFWSGKSTTAKKTLGVDHAELLKENYNESLTKLLLPYKFKHMSDKKPLWTEFKGPYMDFGITSRWRKGGYRAIWPTVEHLETYPPLSGRLFLAQRGELWRQSHPRHPRGL